MHATTPGIKALLSGPSLIWGFGMVLFCLGLFLGVLLSARCCAKQSLSGSPLPSLLSLYFCSQTATATAPLPGHLGKECSPCSLPSLSVPESTVLPQVLHTPSAGLPLADAAGTSLKQISRYMHRKDKLNFCSGNKISCNKVKPFYHWLLLVPPGWSQAENKEIKMFFPVFCHFSGWSVGVCKWHTDTGFDASPKFPR